MSQDNFWENEDSASEQETEPVTVDNESFDYEDLEEQEAEDFESDIEILKNARLRLEQGRLYEMLLKHDLFENVDADQKAVANVQREIRAFIKERLEVLVGLKTDPRLKRSSNSNLNQLFSDVELQVLKEFVGRVAKPKTEDSGLTALKPSISAKSIKPVSKSSNIRSNPEKHKSTLQKAKKPTSNDTPRLTKHPSQMTIDELKEYNKGLSARQASRKSAAPSKKIPMPDSTQIQTLYSSRVQTDPGMGLVGAIMAKMGKTVNTIENVGDGGVEDSGNDSRI